MRDILISVRLLESLGSDASIAHRAHLSRSTEPLPEDRVEPLIKSLIDREHWSVFEFGILTFEITAPLYSVAQIERHRTGSYLEQSLRYSIAEPLTCKPDIPESEYEFYEKCMQECFDRYNEALKRGWKRENARILLPQNHMKTFVMQIDLRNLFNFFKLRLSKAAQKETRIVAEQMRDLAATVFPLSLKHFFCHEKYK